MRIAALAAALALACVSVPADASPRGHVAVSPECNVTMPCDLGGAQITQKALSKFQPRRDFNNLEPRSGGAQLRAERREDRRRARGQQLYDAMPFGMPTDRLGRALSVSEVIGGRPSGCPHRFCGCGASLHLFGKIIPALNLAANWLRFPRTSPAPNMVAARRGHVFVLKRHIGGSVWLVHDSNSGGGKTRLHPRSIAGYVIVNPNGGPV